MRLFSSPSLYAKHMALRDPWGTRTYTRIQVEVIIAYQVEVTGGI